MSLRHALLGVLRDGPLHGYRLADELERRVAGGRFASAQVYQGLRWLAQRGFVTLGAPEAGTGRDRRPYTITAEGLREFEGWLRGPFSPSRPARDDAIVKLVFVGREDVAQLVEQLERLRRQHLRRLTGGRPWASKALAGLPERLFAELSGVALRFREEAELRWIDHCLLRLRPLLNEETAAAGISTTENTRASPPGGRAR